MFSSRFSFRNFVAGATGVALLVSSSAAATFGGMPSPSTVAALPPFQGSANLAFVGKDGSIEPSISATGKITGLKLNTVDCASPLARFIDCGNLPPEADPVKKPEFRPSPYCPGKMKCAPPTVELSNETIGQFRSYLAEYRKEQARKAGEMIPKAPLWYEGFATR